jgi:diadenosine tetraphosphate (Ap4A) HIT family hydrolase
MNEQSCPFCGLDESRQIIAENEQSIAIYDKYPVNPGHALIIPKRHCASYFDLSIEEQMSCIALVNQVKSIIDKTYAVNDFNIGINVGEAAGQTIFHVHIHLIPRYKGDVDDPMGGVRGVIPDRRRY